MITEARRTNHRPLRSSPDLDPLLERIGTSSFVLLGEASHGTHQYYTWRTAITKRLISEKRFSFIAVEGDWPDCYRINRYVKGFNDHGTTAVDVLKTFKRWPTWMWADDHYWKNRFQDYAGHRAIGVVYHPEYERGNYVPTLLWKRYDALIYIDQSTALHPLHLQPDGSQMPETYPFGV